MMKLSEAIREGCKYGPQMFGLFLDSQGGGGSCAMGAGYKGMVGDVRANNFSATAEDRENLRRFQNLPICFAVVAYPCEHHKLESMSLWTVVVHLNNHHRWSREAISEWVEVIERKLGLWDSPVVEEAVQASVVEAEKMEKEKANV